MEQKVKAFLGRYGQSSNPAVSFFFHSLYALAKEVKRFLFLPQKIYENWVAKFIAKYLWFFYWPLYKICEYLGVRFLINIIPATGHVILEFDYFFRCLFVGNLNSSKKYVFLSKNRGVYRDFLSLYGHHLWFFSTSTMFYNLMRPLLMKFHPILVDVGLAQVKYHLPPKKLDGILLRNKPYSFQYSGLKWIEEYKKYFSVRKKSLEYYPLLNTNISSESLLSQLQVSGKKICLIQIKSAVMNATALPTDPATYLSALSYLVDLGYSLVFVGREQMPCEFRRFGMVNYSESKVASFKNDILLFKAADLAILGGSGIFSFCECLNKPYLFLNYWHIACCPFNANSIFVPALVGRQGEGLLTFAKQFQLHLETTDQEEQKFPSSQFYARNASSEEILCATQELIENLKAPVPLSQLQRKFMTIDEGKGWMADVLSRPSHFFLEKHSSLF